MDNRVLPFVTGAQLADWVKRNCNFCVRSFDNGGRCEIESELVRASRGNGTVSQTVASRMGQREGVFMWDCPERMGDHMASLKFYMERRMHDEFRKAIRKNNLRIRSLDTQLPAPRS